MIESPLQDELMSEMRAQALQDTILDVLEGRFGTLPPNIGTALRGILEEARLHELARWTGQCADLAAFRSRLTGGV